MNDVQQQFNDAVAAHRQGDHSRAVAICDEIISGIGERPEVLNLKAVVLAEAGQMIHARQAVLSALENSQTGLKPELRATLLLHAARISSALDLFEEAFEFVNEASNLGSSDPGVNYQRARLALLLGDLDLASKLVQECLEQLPEFREAQMLQAQIAMESRDLAFADSCYEEIVRAVPGHARAWAGLAEVRRTKAGYEFPDGAGNDTVLTGLLKIHDARADDGDWATATFALADALVRGGNHSAAFDLYHQANQSLSKASSWDIDAWNADISRKIEPTIWNVQSLEDPELPNPLFIVGMPRSGSWLLERMLGAHPGVGTSGERQAMPFIERHLGFTTEPIAPDLAKQMNALYRQGMNVSADQKWVCDKANRNFERVNLIRALFPNTKIIWIIRNPLDTIISCYFQDFQRGLAYTHSLENLTQMYYGHWRLMNRWLEFFGDAILPVQYESLVNNSETVLQVVCDFLGLDFDSGMLEPHLQKNPVRTASTLQVQQPIQNDSFGRWRHYEQQLGNIPSLLQASNILDVNGDTLLPAGVL